MGEKENNLFVGIVPFVAAAETRSFRKAAARLGLTPSAVSKAISRLEQDVGARLLNRSARNVTLTDEGESFLLSCRDAVSNVVSQIAIEFSEPVNVASVSAGDVRIYTPNGLLPGSNQTYLALEPTILRVNVNPQNVPGNYRVEVGPLIEGLLAPRMSQVYTGAFSITLPLISGFEFHRVDMSTRDVKAFSNRMISPSRPAVTIAFAFTTSAT